MTAIFFILIAFLTGYTLMKRQRNINRQAIIVDDTASTRTAAKKTTKGKTLDDLIGHTIAVDTRLLKIGIVGAMDCSTSDVELLKYLCGIAQVCLLVKVQNQEEANEVSAALLGAFQGSGLEAHRILPFTVEESKKSVVRQLSPDYYLDNNTESYEYNKRFVPNLVQVGECLDSPSVTAYFAETFGLIF